MAAACVFFLLDFDWPNLLLASRGRVQLSPVLLALISVSLVSISAVPVCFWCWFRSRFPGPAVSSFQLLCLGVSVLISEPCCPTRFKFGAVLARCLNEFYTISSVFFQPKFLILCVVCSFELRIMFLLLC